MQGFHDLHEEWKHKCLQNDRASDKNSVSKTFSMLEGEVEPSNYHGVI